jgi:hypothetical protein
MTTETQRTLSEDDFKRLVKEALVETLQEHCDLVREVVIEAFEDVALAEAIQQGRGTKRVSRKVVFDLIRRTGDARCRG